MRSIAVCALLALVSLFTALRSTPTPHAVVTQLQWRGGGPSLTELRRPTTTAIVEHRAQKHYSPCPPPKQCDTIPPIVIISPPGGIYPGTTDSVAVTVYFCGFKNLDDTTRYINYYLSHLASQWTYSKGNGFPRCPINHRTSDAVATGELHLIDGNNQMAAGISTPGPDGVFGYTTVYWNYQPRHQISVVANAGAITAARSVNGTTQFTITNLGQRLDTIVVTPTCTGGGNLTCTTGVDSLYLKPGTDTVISVGWQTNYGLLRVGGRPKSTVGVLPGVHPAQSPAGGGPAPIGSVSVVGYVKFNPSLRDSAFTDVSPQTSPIGVFAGANNPGTRIQRDLCLTLSIAPGAAYQCADLRLTHVLPAVRTYSQVRAPALIYTSQMAHPHPLINALVSLNTNHGTPDTVVARLTVNNVLVDTIRYTGSNAALFANGATERIVLGYDALANGTGLNNFYLAVSAIYNSAHIDTTYNDSGRVGSIGGQWNKYGAGWFVAGVEGLKNYGSTGMFWVDADGSLALYSPVTGQSNTWAPPLLERPDTIKLVTVSGHNYYIRYASHGAQVWFDATTLQQVKVVDRLKDTTSFAYAASGAIASITVPSPNGGLQYVFNYNGSGYLTSITAPANGSTARTVTITQNSSHQITSIKDPDGDSIVFQYSGSYANVVTARTDPRGTISTFAYDAGQRLSRVVVDTGTSHLQITTAYTAQETIGLAGPVTPSAAFTTVNGPRKDTTVTKIWGDVQGEPLEIQNAMQKWTLISRTSTTYPALVTRIKYPNERVITEAYDARGNPIATTDSSIAGFPTDSFSFDQKWDFIAHTTKSLGEQWWAQYDTSNGNRTWEQVGPLTDSTRRVHYGYNGIRRLASTAVPLTRRDSILYDSTGLGNVIAHRTPANYWTYSYRDAIGRDTVDMIPVDSADHSVTGTGYTRVRHHAAFDILDRVIADSTFGAAVTISTIKFSGSIPAETLMVWTYYNPDGAVDSVRRRAGPDTNHIKTQKTYYTRDAINRVVRQYYPEPDSLLRFDLFTYDAASNVTQRMDRNGTAINQTYDVMNRVIQRTIPEEDQPPFTWGTNSFPDFPNVGGYYILWADTAQFTYDLMGNLRRAQNHDAIVARQYDPRGLVIADSLLIRTYQQTDSGGQYSHAYEITNTYDREGRRTQLTYPYLAFYWASFNYDPITGLLASTTGPDSSTVTFSTDAALRNDSTAYPGGVYERLFFDSAGRVQRRLGTGSASGTFHSDTLWYDARGNIIQADQIKIRSKNTYSPLGALIASEMIDSTRPTTPGYTTEAHETDAFGNDFLSFANSPPPIGTTTIPQTYRTYYYYPYEARVGKVWQGCGGPITPNLNNTADVSDTTYFLPDGSEALVGWDNATPACLSSGSAVYEFRLSMYGGDAKLRVIDMKSTQPSTASAGDFEEFWYDALGRRVYRRSRRPTGTGNCEQVNVCHSVIERYVWDGDQLLQEDRALDAGGDTTRSTLENELSDGKWSGVVQYVHAGGVDAPVEVMRRYAESPLDQFAVFPHANWRGLPDLATFTNGQTQLSSGTDSVVIAWPAQSMMQSYQLRYQTADLEWVGGLTAQQRDPTGALYMRNRYYDSQTGRFTQEDPLGLGGGLNAYGFAGGDPVNYTDPFGLYIEPIRDPDLRRVVGALLQHSTTFARVWLKLAQADKNVVDVTFRYAETPDEIRRVHETAWGQGLTLSSKGGAKEDPSQPFITVLINPEQKGVNDYTIMGHEMGHVGGRASARGVDTGVNQLCGGAEGGRLDSGPCVYPWSDTVNTQMQGVPSP